MSRWAETFATLSSSPDTPDTMRHSGNPPSTVSRSVKSVTASSPPKPRLAAVDCALAIWSEAQEERAAVIEYDGGAPRAWAEALARLDPTRPPRHVSVQRWLRFIDDCSHFVDNGWAARAAAFGWGPLHLFGWDRKRPFARIDHLGLLWEVNGGKLVELHRDRAIIEIKSGARFCHRRQPLEVGRIVLAWELVS